MCILCFCTSGCCAVHSDSATERSRQIDRELRSFKKEHDKILHLLLLGAGECGKSTVVKQMRIIYADGFDDTEKSKFVEVIRDNVLRAIASILQAMPTLKIDLENSSSQESVETILKFQTTYNSLVDSEIPESITKAVEAVWKDAGVQTCYNRSNEYQLIDAAKYFIEQIDKIASSLYFPTEEDIVRARKQTTDVVDIVLNVETNIHRGVFKITDVGGQRNCRRKWISAFEGVKAIIWVAALSDYDMIVKEDEKQKANRMKESLVLFEQTIHLPIFTQKNIVLFLNKTDIFKSKIKVSPIANYFPTFTGGAGYIAGCKFFENEFQSKNNNEGRKIYPHFTCATDTKSLAHLINSVMNTLIEEYAIQAGF